MTPDEVRGRLAALDKNGTNAPFPPPETSAGLTLAAVLIPLVMRADSMTAIFTQRTEHLNDHAGQVSFPGGRAEPGDRGPVDTALRETEEEIGLAADAVEVVGRLGAHDTSTGFLVVPVVGLVAPTYSLTLDTLEVAAAFEVPLAFLFDPANKRRKRTVHRGRVRSSDVYDYEGHIIWGATARIVASLRTALFGR